ncbi:putative DNA-binding domain, KAT8 regulatory NSL complex subunit 2 [Rosa chinensis]|uniref:KAT8 regulatory NSL complex subunit 2 n=1 Tax=Rosa chinensis TaxID=74649 RepID=A0A2P6PNV6_ROSCH|nr:uncharacterized protein LOC112173139 [Rosa chinensis]PRQ23602.1 putative DNA-binding domain, KAT8 regulatory NSL complex subunit 2 [Rosa chinensis]
MTGGASSASRPPPEDHPITAAEIPSTSAAVSPVQSMVPRQEVLRRRSQNLKQLTKCYRDHYWALMEDLKIHYRDYYWNYGVSPLQFKPLQDNADDGNINRRCASVGCKLTAMALTSFCHLHILSDSKQRLYKACDYVIKSAQAGPITCGKPILRSTTPSLCAVHFQKAQKHVTRALRKAGLNVSSSSKLAPKFHVILAEYVHQIQSMRKAARKENRSKVAIKEEAVD